MTSIDPESPPGKILRAMRADLASGESTYAADKLEQLVRRVLAAPDPQRRNQAASAVLKKCHPNPHWLGARFVRSLTWKQWDLLIYALELWARQNGASAGRLVDGGPVTEVDPESPPGKILRAMRAGLAPEATHYTAGLIEQRVRRVLDARKALRRKEAASAVLNWCHPRALGDVNVPSLTVAQWLGLIEALKDWARQNGASAGDWVVDGPVTEIDPESPPGEILRALRAGLAPGETHYAADELEQLVLGVLAAPNAQRRNEAATHVLRTCHPTWLGNLIVPSLTWRQWDLLIGRLEIWARKNGASDCDPVVGGPWHGGLAMTEIDTESPPGKVLRAMRVDLAPGESHTAIDFVEQYVRRVLVAPNAQRQSEAANAVMETCRPRWLGDVYVPHLTWGQWLDLIDALEEWARQKGAIDSESPPGKILRALRAGLAPGETHYAADELEQLVLGVLAAPNAQRRNEAATHVLGTCHPTWLGNLIVPSLTWRQWDLLIYGLEVWARNNGASDCAPVVGGLFPPWTTN